MSVLRPTIASANKNAVRTEYFRYLIPTVVGMIAHSFYCLADVFFVGIKVGSNGLAALNVSLPIFTIYTTISVLFGVGAATTISICRGEKNLQNIDRIFSQAVVFVLAIGILFSVLVTPNLEKVAVFFGATDAISKGVRDYLLPVNLSAFIYMISSTLTIIIRSDGNPRLVMIACTAGNLLNIILDFLFVIVLDMGVFGAGLATAIGPMVTVILLGIHFIKKYNHIHFVWKFPSWKILKRTIQNGAGSSVLEFTSGIVILMFNIVLISLSGEKAVAIFSIISNIGYVGKGIFNGMAQAAQPIIGESYGAGKYRNMVLANRYASLTALIFSIVVYVVILLFPSNIISLFISNEPDIVRMGTAAVVLYFLSFPFTGQNTILMYYFQSIEHVRYTIILSFMRGIVLTFIALILLSAFAGIYGVWLSLFSAEAITFICFYPLKRNLNRILLDKERNPNELKELDIKI